MNKDFSYEKGTQTLGKKYIYTDTQTKKDL